MTISSLGLGSGLDLNGILEGFMQIEATQQTKLKSKVTENQSKVSQYQALNAKFLTVKANAEALNIASQWKLNKATSSDASVVATANSNAIAGNLSFKVQSLASAHVMASSGTVTGLDGVIGTGQHTMGNYASLGIATATPNGMTAGKHTIEVTQASAAAKVSGTAVAASTVIGPSNNTINASINGAATAFNIPDGTYTRQELVDQLNVSGAGSFTAELNADNTISFSTVREGSAAGLRFNSSNGLASLGLAASGVTATGTNGIVNVDGVTNTVTNTSNPQVLNSTTGTITASFAAGGLNLGTGSLEIYDYGDGKLSTIVNNINSLNGSMTASAIQVSPGQYKLQLASKETGEANALTIDPNSFSSSGLGTMQTVTAAADARLLVGDGPGAYTISSKSNTFTDSLPGVTLTVTTADPTKTINVGVKGDVDGLADKVEAMIKSAADAMQHIKDNSKFDAATKRAGALLGNSTAVRLQRQLFSETMNPIAGSSLGGSVAAVGIKTDANGTITFDRAAFKAAYEKDPEAVAKMFIDGGTTGATTGALGIADRLAKLGKSATGAVDGQITTVIAGVNKTIENINKSIEAWDDRLAQRRATLTRQFTALDTAVAGFKSQSTWLAGQITSLQSNR